MSAVRVDCICFEKGRERTILKLFILHQNCSDDFTEVFFSFFFFTKSFIQNHIKELAKL